MIGLVDQGGKRGLKLSRRPRIICLGVGNINIESEGREFIGWGKTLRNSIFLNSGIWHTDQIHEGLKWKLFCFSQKIVNESPT